MSGGPDPAAVTVEWRVLGDFQVRWRGREASIPWTRRKPRELFKWLLLRADRVVTTEQVIDAFWPEHSLAQVRNYLHVCVGRLRRALKPFGANRLETVAGGYVWRILPGDWLDLHEFARLAGQVESSLGDRDCPDRAFASLERLIDLYRGDLLTDEPYADWCAVERARIHGTFVHLLGRAATARRSLGHLESACTLLRRLLDLEPTYEDRALDLAECLFDLHDVSAASAVLTDIERTLTCDVGSRPGPRWTALRQRLTK